jgi:hypothetical protein
MDQDSLTHLDRAVWPVPKRRARPVAAGPVSVALGEAVMVGWVRLASSVRARLRYLVEFGHDLIRSQRDPGIPVGTGRGLGWPV